MSHKNNLNACQQARFLGARYAKFACAAGALPRTPLGELTALRRLLAGKGKGPQGSKGIMEGKRKESKGWGWKKRGGNGKGRRGKGEGREGREKGWRRGRVPECQKLKMFKCNTI